ncbi:MAG: flavin reductase [Alphaproteobacteria bacterium]|nr:MAG: flavin reductase [Alphaproteobacteria bacterium]
MTITAEEFKQGMRMLCGGVTIVTTKHAGQASGLTATAVCSLSAEPPRILACINRGGTTYGMVSQSRRFCVNVLTADQAELASCFAGMLRIGTEDRFNYGEWTRLTTGSPVLEDALASFDCTVSSIMDTGSHAIIIGDIVEVQVSPGGDPLLYMDGQFSTRGPIPDNGAGKGGARSSSAA